MADPVSAQTPLTIANHEQLGQHEWYKSDAKRVLGRLDRGEPPRVKVQKFMPPPDSCELSVDRMDHCDLRTLADLAETNTTRADRSLQGWYTLSAGDVLKANCAVRSTPLPRNPYHADIAMPVNLDSADCRDDLMEYARDLAYSAGFKPR